MDYARWMTDDPKIHGKLLSGICLPMTHDSGTFDLANVLVEQLPAINTLATIVVAGMKAFGIRPYGEDPQTWFDDIVYGPVRGLATTTRQDVGAQLRSGIRGFDFRIYNDAGTYYTYHGLRSTSTFGAMLDQMAEFLRADAAEIIYVNLSHYLGFDDSGLRTFGSFVRNKLGDFAYRRTGTNDPFDESYEQIVNQGGVRMSRVILVSDRNLGDDEIFWPREYCPLVTQDPPTVLVGEYSESSDPGTMIDKQVEHFHDALEKALPFADFLILTPDQGQYTDIIGAAVYDACRQLQDSLAAHGHSTWASLMGGIVRLLQGYKDGADKLGWRTLEELAARIGPQLSSIVDNRFLPLAGDTNRISMIFCDFFEETLLVDLCIALGDDMEVVWGGDSAIKVDGKKLESKLGPSAAMYADGKLYMVYRGKSSEDLYFAAYDPPAHTWVSNQRIKDMPGGSDIDPKSDKSPAIVVRGQSLYVVWRNAGGTSLRLAAWDGATWSGGGEIRVGTETLRSSSSPALALYGSDVVMVHRDKDDDTLHWETYDVSGNWNGGDRIMINGPDPKTSTRPALVAYSVDGVPTLYLLFKGRSTGNLLQCTYDGTSWTGNTVITTPAPRNPPDTDFGPGAATFQGLIYMFDRQKSSSDLWFATYDGVAWSAIATIESTNANIDPKTNSSVWAVRVGPSLMVLYRRDNSEELYQTMLSATQF